MIRCLAILRIYIFTFFISRVERLVHCNTWKTFDRRFFLVKLGSEALLIIAVTESNKESRNI